MPLTRPRLRERYFGVSKGAVRFQSAWLMFDIILIGFFVVAPFIEHAGAYLALNYVIAAVLGLDLLARAWAFGDVRAWLKRPLAWADLVVMTSLVINPNPQEDQYAHRIEHGPQY